MTRLVVTDGEQRSALAVVRSLGRAGHDVHVVSGSGRSLAGASRHAASDTVAPDPHTDRAGYARAVRDVVIRRSCELLLPLTEASLHALLPSVETLTDVRVPSGGYEAFLRVSDKTKVAEVAREVGIAVPDGIRIAAPDDFSRKRLEGVPAFPVVVKPSRSVVVSGEGLRTTSVLHATDEEELAEILSGLLAFHYPVLVQERIPGYGTGVFLLRWEGELLAAFAHRRLREKPPGGGASVLRESVELDPTLREASLRLLERLGWEGVAMVEYRTEAATGRPYLMEVNPRFWGSLQLAIDAGVDFPKLLVEAVEGRRPAPLPPYRAGVRTRWLWGDVDHLVSRLRRSREELRLPSQSPGRGRAVVDFLASFGVGCRSEVWRRDDPGPFLRETGAWFRALAGGSREAPGGQPARASDPVSP